MMLEYFRCESKSIIVNRAHNLLTGPVGNYRKHKHDELSEGDPWVYDPWTNKGLLANQWKHGYMHEMV